jgi:hypothetical protein
VISCQQKKKKKHVIKKKFSVIYTIIYTQCPMVHRHVSMHASYNYTKVEKGLDEKMDKG